MKVKDLKKWIQDLNDECEILIWDHEYGEYYPLEIKDTSGKILITKGVD